MLCIDESCPPNWKVYIGNRPNYFNFVVKMNSCLAKEPKSKEIDNS